MTEKEKMLNGQEYFPCDETLVSEREKCKLLCQEYNVIPVNYTNERQNVIKKLLGRTGEKFLIEQSFWCDYGYNIEIGENFYSNHNLVILDSALVKFGKNVFIGPNCGFYTAEHSVIPQERNKGAETAKPITVGDNVWFGGNVAVMPGVTIGNNVTIGAGSVVTRDIPDNSLAFGNPCKVQKNIQ